MAPNPDDPDFGSEYRRRESPKLRARRQRSERIGGLIVAAGGVAIVVEAARAFRRDGWDAVVHLGAYENYRTLPWWWQMAAGLFALIIVGWALGRRDPPG